MTLALVVLLLSLTIIDGVLTLELLGMHGEEANPVMEYLLDRGPLTFLLGKYVLTAFGLPFIVVYKNYPMFGTRFRAGFMIHVFIGMYVALIAYQWALLRSGPGHSPGRGRADIVAASFQSGAPPQEFHDDHEARCKP
jgi:hypothetical protein